MKINDEIILNTEKMVFGLDCISKKDGCVVFTVGSLPNEKIKAKIISINKSYAKAKTVEIIEPSKNRIKPVCPLYNACGSCKGQFSSYDYLIDNKSKILKEIFHNLIDEKNIYPVQKSPIIEQYRHKLQFPLRRTKNSKRLLIGYYKENSHDLVNIKYCPMQPKIINEILDFIRNNCPTSCYDDKTKKGLLKNLLIRMSSFNNKMLLVFVLNTKKGDIDKDFKNFIEKLKENFKEIEGIFVNFNDKNNNTILSDATEKILGGDFIVEKIGCKKYKIGPISFFQVNPACAGLLFNRIKEKIKPKSSILDAFGGVGAIGIQLDSDKITLLEENQDAIFWARENFKLNNIENFEILDNDANKNFEILKKQNKTFDYVIVDPPRKGLGNEGLKSIKDLSNNIIYISCNPMTLKRDVEYLQKEGFIFEYLEGFDFFPYTHHIECLAFLTRK